jgi:site-specific DNA recombinase
MSHRPAKRVRCAIYTRVSTEYGLEQDFNSLDAQHEAAEAYVRSQAQEGWTLSRARYDDGGYSGGSTDRPALQQLLADIRTRKIDVVVVYKVDRLTRSLADFAKLVELFDAHGVSFVSVTQQFNTTTSMGRLTLNVLLSFAQFEREVTSERIRDKIAASKRKGLWVGGMVPLGYESRERRLVVNEAEAARVRSIFQRYLELGSIGLLLVDLRRSGIVTKARQLANGRTIGGIPFTRGPLAHLLRNRFYIGEVVYKGKICPGEQPAILDRERFEAVQAKLSEQRTSHHAARGSSASLLRGRIFDDRGHRMTPSHSRKQGLRYRYYVSSVLTQGQPELAGSVTRVPAAEIESLVCAAVGQHFATEPAATLRELVRTQVARVEITATTIRVTVNPPPGSAPDQQSNLAVPREQGEHDDRELGMPNADHQPNADPVVLSIPWSKRPAKRYRELLIPHDGKGSDIRPLRPETRAKLVSAIARGRLWLAQMQSGAVTNVQDIALRENSSKRHVNMTISLAFLAPSLVKAAVEGRLPHGIGVARMFDLPPGWARQFQILGLAQPPSVETRCPG